MIFRGFFHPLLGTEGKVKNLSQAIYKDRMCCGMVVRAWVSETEVLAAQSHLTLCYPMDCGAPDSSSGILEWAAISFSRGSSWPRDQTRVAHIAGRSFTIWASREAPWRPKPLLNLSLGLNPGSITVISTALTKSSGFRKPTVTHLKRKNDT